MIQTSGYLRAGFGNRGLTSDSAILLSGQLWESLLTKRVMSVGENVSSVQDPVTIGLNKRLKNTVGYGCFKKCHGPPL